MLLTPSLLRGSAGKNITARAPMDVGMFPQNDECHRFGETGSNRVAAANGRLTKPMMQRDESCFFFCFRCNLHDSGRDSEGEQKVVALREQSAQMCPSVRSQFGFCGETLIPPSTFSFPSFRRCGLVSIAA